MNRSLFTPAHIFRFASSAISILTLAVTALHAAEPTLTLNVWPARAADWLNVRGFLQPTAPAK